MQNQRPFAISNPRGIYFVTFSVVQWVDVFTRSIYRDIVVESMKYCIEHKGLILYAWCLMSNHMHLIVGTRDDHNLSDIIRDLKKFTSKRIVEAIDLKMKVERVGCSGFLEVVENEIQTTCIFSFGSKGIMPSNSTAISSCSRSSTMFTTILLRRLS